MDGAASLCDRGCTKGRPKCARCIHSVVLETGDEDLQRVVDAVSGATWGTRNSIMEGLFFEQLEADPAGVPAYRPPGSA